MRVRSPQISRQRNSVCRGNAGDGVVSDVGKVLLDGDVGFQNLPGSASRSCPRRAGCGLNQTCFDSLFGQPVLDRCRRIRAIRPGHPRSPVSGCPITSALRRDLSVESGARCATETSDGSATNALRRIRVGKDLQRVHAIDEWRIAADPIAGKRPCSATAGKPVNADGEAAAQTSRSAQRIPAILSRRQEESFHGRSSPHPTKIRIEKVVHGSASNTGA